MSEWDCGCRENCACAEDEGRETGKGADGGVCPDCEGSGEVCTRYGTPASQSDCEECARDAATEYAAEMRQAWADMY